MFSLKSSPSCPASNTPHNHVKASKLDAPKTRVIILGSLNTPSMKTSISHWNASIRKKRKEEATKKWFPCSSYRNRCLMPTLSKYPCHLPTSHVTSSLSHRSTIGRIHFRPPRKKNHPKSVRDYAFWRIRFCVFFFRSFDIVRATAWLQRQVR